MKIKQKNIISITRSILAAPFYIFIVITVTAFFLLLGGGMPQTGIDSSWMFAMNQSLAKHLSIGQEIVFTLGPYAAAYTYIYDPATDYLMIIGGLVLGLNYAASLLYLARDQKRHLVLFLVVLIGLLGNKAIGAMGSRDALYFSYPFLLSICLIQAVDENAMLKDIAWRQIFILFLLLTPLGLLPLVKGSFLIVCLASALLIAIYLCCKKRFTAAVLTLGSPVISVVIFWKIAGQRIDVLPDYLLNSLFIISGYTEAMAVHGRNIEIWVYLVVAVIVFFVSTQFNKRSISNSIFLSLSLGLFFFIAFKASFVRHDSHAQIAAATLVISTLVLWLRYQDKRLFMVLLLASVSAIYINNHYVPASVSQFFKNIVNTYILSWDGLSERLSGNNVLQNQFSNSLADIRKECALPSLNGSIDIYPNEQACAIASNNTWNPRPIFQSYSAYTPELIRLNEQHLRRAIAPENVLFRVAPIDSRYPALEDGLSWLALLDNYKVTKIENDQAHLQRNQSLKDVSQLVPLFEREVDAGQPFTIPPTDAMVFSEIAVKPTLLGKLFGFIFKPPQLKEVAPLV